MGAGGLHSLSGMEAEPLHDTLQQGPVQLITAQFNKLLSANQISHFPTIYSLMQEHDFFDQLRHVRLLHNLPFMLNTPPGSMVILLAL